MMKSSVKPKAPTRCGVKIFTWGTSAPGDHSLLEDVGETVIPTLTHGANIGHASMQLTIPHTPENEVLVSEALTDKPGGIPWKVVTYATPTAQWDEKSKSMQVDAQKTVYEEKVIEIYYSWWPGEGSTWWPSADQKNFNFTDFEQDTMLERVGVAHEYDPQWEEYLEPEKRREVGALSYIRDQAMTLAPGIVVHYGGHTPEEIAVLNGYQKYIVLTAQYLVIDLLQSKLKSHDDDKVVLNLTETQLLRAAGVPVEKGDLMTLSEIQPILALKSRNLSDQLRLTICQYIEALFALNGEREYELTGKQPTHFWKLKDTLASMAIHRQIHQALLTYEESKKETKDKDVLLSVIRLDPGASQIVDKSGIDAKTIQELKIYIDEQLNLANGPNFAIIHEIYSKWNFIKTLAAVKADNLISQSVFSGQQPDHEVRLPLQSELDPNGLNPHDMLTAMSSKMHGEEYFNVLINNCSRSCCDIISAGVGEEKRDLIQQGGLGRVFSPQLLLDNAFKLSTVLIQERLAAVEQHRPDPMLPLESTHHEVVSNVPSPPSPRSETDELVEKDDQNKEGGNTPHIF